MTLTKREEFVVLYTALLLIPERNLDYDSRQRILRCAEIVIAGEMTDEMKKSGGNQKLTTEIDDEVERIEKSVNDQLTKLQKLLTACYGSSKDDREFSDFTN
mgnify:FL=1